MKSRTSFGFPPPAKATEHIACDPFQVEINRVVIGLPTKRAKVFYKGIYVGDIELQDGRWIIPGSKGSLSWERPMYPANLVVKRWLRATRGR